MTNWIYFPKSDRLPDHLAPVLGAFEMNSATIDSTTHDLVSDEVLAAVRGNLLELHFFVENGKRKSEKIQVPVLFGFNGKLERYFEADGFNPETKTVIEVEAGRAYVNYQFLKDLFQACVMHDVDYLVIAVRKEYKGNKDFEKIASFFDTLYVSDRLKLPLKGLLLVGY